MVRRAVADGDGDEDQRGVFQPTEGLVCEVMLPASVGEAEVDRIGHRGVEGGGDALEAGESG
jgi:hypothetical protein